MNRRTVLLIAVALVLAAGYGVMMAASPEARPWGKTNDRRSNRQAGAGDRTMDASGHETVALTLEIPAAADVPGGNVPCFKTRLGNILGITLAEKHGLVVGTVVAGGAADKAGIKPGDMLGAPSECPQTALPRFEASEQPREMKVQVRRPRGSSEAKAEETAPAEQETSVE
jgi:hypothetical protein